MSTIRVALLLLVFVIATLLGIVIAFGPGYLTIVVGPWELRTSIWVALLAIVVVTVAVLYVIKLIKIMLPRNSKVAAWFQAKRATSANHQVLRALDEEANGNVIEAIRLLMAAGAQSPNPIVYYLRACDLAERIGANEKASELRAKVVEFSADKAPVYHSYQNALSALDSDDKQVGIRKLRRLLEQHPHCAPALARLIEYCLASGDWVAAQDYIAILERLTYVTADETQDLALRSWIGRLKAASPEGLAALWRNLPKEFRHESQLVEVYVDALIASDQASVACRELENQLKHSWRSAWVGTYGRIEFDSTHQIKQVEKWLAKHPNDAVLALTLGRLQKRQGNNEVAAQQLERAVQYGAGIDAELEMAELHVQTGASELALHAMANVKEKLASR